MGWYGFNAGAAYKSPGIASYAILNTQTASVISFFLWIVLGWISSGFKKLSIINGFNGAIAGLAGITGASGYVNDLASIPIGLMSSFLAFITMRLKDKLNKLLKNHRRFQIHDTIDVFAIHGVSGACGSLMIGLFASRKVNRDLKWQGLFYEEFHSCFNLLFIQIFSLIFAIVWAMIATFIILMFLKCVSGLVIENYHQGGDKIIDEFAYQDEQPQEIEVIILEH
jgi:ammonium transporter, Amt family